jgi:flagellar biosynthesis/type III secretory pathway M-ring protein FliF/YscJ
MSMDSNWLVVLSMAVLFAVAMFLMRRMSTRPEPPNELVQLEEKMDRLGKELRYDIMEASRNDRQELSQNLTQFQQTLTEQLALMQANMNSQLLALGEGNTRRMAEVCEILDQ